MVKASPPASVSPLEWEMRTFLVSFHIQLHDITTNSLKHFFISMNKASLLIQASAKSSVKVDKVHWKL